MVPLKSTSIIPILVAIKKKEGKVGEKERERLCLFTHMLRTHTHTHTHLPICSIYAVSKKNVFICELKTILIPVHHKILYIAKQVTKVFIDPTLLKVYWATGNINSLFKSLLTL